MLRLRESEGRWYYASAVTPVEKSSRLGTPAALVNSLRVMCGVLTPPSKVCEVPSANVKVVSSGPAFGGVLSSDEALSEPTCHSGRRTHT